MRGTENMEMKSGLFSEEDPYVNVSDTNGQRMKGTTKAKACIPAAWSTQYRVIVALGVLLILALLIVVILTSLLFIYYQRLSGIESYMQNNASNAMSKVTEIESSLKLILTNNTTAFHSNQIQRIWGVLGKLTEDVQKLNSSGPICSAGWTQYGLSCYYLSSDSKPWNASKKDCEDRNAHLITINGEEELDFLNCMSKKKHLWIGLTDADGSWKWVDGTPYDRTTTFWEEGQPDDWTGHNLGGGEDCVELRNEKWNDDHCSKELQYVCEKKLF